MKQRRRFPCAARRVVLVLFAFASLLAPARADDESDRERRLVAFPTESFYPPPIADLHRPGFGVAFTEVHDEEIADSGSTRFGLRVGGAFGLLRWRRPGGGVQLDLLAGMDAQFDVDNGYDNIGWEGNYGLQASAPLGRRLAVKAGVLHTSSHIGDELIERTGRRRIDYTREELLAGVRAALARSWSIYAEAGYGYELRNRELQQPWRFQTGIDFDPTQGEGGWRRAWFLGLDASATEERDYRVDVALKAGRTFRVEDRRWRLGVEINDGRPNLGEFFQDTEAHVALGVWLDL